MVSILVKVIMGNVNLKKVPKLSNNLAQIRITYDRDQKGVKFEFVGFKPGEEVMVLHILEAMAEIYKSPQFHTEILMNQFKNSVKPLH